MQGSRTIVCFPVHSFTFRINCTTLLQLTDFNFFFMLDDNPPPLCHMSLKSYHLLYHALIYTNTLLNGQIHALYFMSLVCGRLDKEFLVKNILPSLKYITDQGKAFGLQELATVQLYAFGVLSWILLQSLSLSLSLYLLSIPSSTSTRFSDSFPMLALELVPFLWYFS